MNAQMIAKIDRLTPLRIYVQDRVVSERVRSELIETCMDRAVLLPEVPDIVLRDVFRASPSEMTKLVHIKAVILQTESNEDQELPGRHLRKVPRPLGQDKGIWLIDCRPKNWTWIEMMAAGADLTAFHVGFALGTVFEESAKLSDLERITIHKPDPDTDDPHATSFRQRCEHSGMAQLVPTAIVDRSDQSTYGTRLERGPPRKRIKQIGNGKGGSSWRFTGLLMREVRIRTILASVTGSWKSMRSALYAWGSFVDGSQKGRDHFPPPVELLSGFVSTFDNPDTLDKYLMHINKSLKVLAMIELDHKWKREMLKGARKFDVKKDKSFVHAEEVEIIVRELRRRKRHELSEFIPVDYLYQLRAQNEGFPLQFGEPNKTIERTWHSYIEIDGEYVAIWLRKRKNCSRPTCIRRKCICKQFPLACGVCALARMIIKNKNHSSSRARVFPNIRATDSKLINEICFDKGIPRFTWHGPRRGRLEDLVKGKDRSNNPKPTMQEAFESGTWSVMAKSMISYLSSETMNKVRVCTALAANSDSE